MKKLGFIGCGNMAAGLLAGIRRGGPPVELFVCDIDGAKAAAAAQSFSAAVMGIDEMAQGSDMLLLAVKPNVALAVAEEVSAYKKPLISIVAGISGQKLAVCGGRVLRVMPNMPAMVGAGASVLCADTDFDEEEKALAESIFAACGRAYWLPEKMLDAVTAVSGSGPAYAFMFIEALADAGVREGLPRDVATELAAQTLLGAGQYVLTSRQHPGLLKDLVCSPGGTTIEAVKVLSHGFSGLVMDAAAACAEKSREIGRRA